MANEWNITKEELLDSTAEAFAGEDRGGNDENKIVPIVNKGSSAESGAVTAPRHKPPLRLLLLRRTRLRSARQNRISSLQLNRRLGMFRIPHSQQV